MDMRSILSNAILSTEQAIDPLVLRTMVQVQERQDRQRAALEHAVRQLLNLGASAEIDWTAIPSVMVIRRRMASHIPDDERLSGLVIALREE